MDAVFARIDRCASTVGQQVLHDLLRRPAPERAMERDAVARRLAEAPELGQGID